MTVTTLYRIEHACDIDINADIYLFDVGIDMINTSSLLYNRIGPGYQQPSFCGHFVADWSRAPQ